MSSTSQRRIERIDGDERAGADDELVVEAPLELRIQGQPKIVIMRTPGHDEELAQGLLFAEGVITYASELSAMERPGGLTPEEDGNVLELGLGPDAAMPDRSLYSSSSCGVCGKTAIAALEFRAKPVASDLRPTHAQICELPDRLRRSQPLFDTTGGLHAAGAFLPNGESIVIREDVGRHNAVDKLVGWGLAHDRLPFGDAILCVSGRLSFEIVQKAVVAGFSVVVAVSAPSSLAVDLAERFRVTLCGFVRGGRFNIYSHSTRIV